MSAAESSGADVTGAAAGTGVAGPAQVDGALSRTERRWWWSIVAVVGLLTAYDLAEAVSNLIGVVTQVDAYNEFADANGLEIAAIPWALLVGNLLVPPVAFVVALRLARRMPFGARALVLGAGLAVSAAVALSLAAVA